MIDETVISDYQATRPPDADRSVLCHAPFTSLNFDQHGRGRVCCYNWRAVLGTWPQTSIGDMWHGAQATALRRSFLENTTSTGCDLCFDQLRARNFAGALMYKFDWLSRRPGYRPDLQPHAPRVVEFELSNTCNLECVQCQGTWSSLIRRNREHLAPLPMPYTDAFVDELEPYLPHLVEARFLGGEPMLIHLYHLLWERIRAVNPEIELTITTNATVIPERAWAALQDLRSYVCLSIDSLDPDNYARIRKNGRLDVVLANFERWREYVRARGTGVSIAVCPMRYNWRELPLFLDFSERTGAPLAFNTVVRPWTASLAGLPHEELDEVVAYLQAHQPAPGTTNAGAWSGVIEQVRSWRDTRRELDARFRGLVGTVRAAARVHAPLVDSNQDGSAEILADSIARLVAASWLDKVPAIAASQAIALRNRDATHDELTADAADRLRAAGWVTENPADVDLAGRIRNMTPVSVVPGEQPADQRLLLPVLVLLNNMGLFAGHGPVVPAPVEPNRLAGDARAIERLAAALPPAIDWARMWWLLIASLWQPLGTWVGGVVSDAEAATNTSAGQTLPQ